MHFKYSMLLLVMFLAGCHNIEADIYELDKIESIVTDINTGEPISGASVMAVWTLYGYWSFGFHSATSADLYIAETITEKDGYFEIVPPERLKSFDKGSWKMDRLTPTVYIFHEGYLPESRYNSQYNPVTVRKELSWGGYKTIGKMDFTMSDGVVIALEPAEIDYEKYVRGVRSNRWFLQQMRCRVLEIPIFQKRILGAFKESFLIPTGYDAQYGIKQKLEYRDCDGQKIES